LPAVDQPLLPDREQQERLLHLTLPDAGLTLAQQPAGKPQHGRKETRTLWALWSPALNGYVGSAGTAEATWPHVGQVLRVQRIVDCWDVASRSWQRTVEVAYAISSLPPQRADAATLLRYWRAHWQIENGLHWVRDVTFGEDACQVFTGRVAEALTILRNAALPLLCTLRRSSVAAAMRQMALRPETAIALFESLSRRLAGQTLQSGP
jgi:hypothetical protein